MLSNRYTHDVPKNIASDSILKKIILSLDSIWIDGYENLLNEKIGRSIFLVECLAVCPILQFILFIRGIHMGLSESSQRILIY